MCVSYICVFVEVREGHWTPADRDRGDCEPHRHCRIVMVPWKSRECSEPLQNLSIPDSTIFKDPICVPDV